MKLSVILPAYNEEENIKEAYNKIKKSFENLKKLDYEVIFVNDGSTDKTREELNKLNDERVKVINFEKRKGKSFALFTGIKNAINDIIVTLDADLQDDPGDIPKLLERLDEGYDLVCGWRHKRKDNFIKRVSTKVGNYINNGFLNIELHDNNCPLKVFKKKCVENMIVFDHWHRFIPVLTKIQGFKIIEEKVNHYPRIYGKTKYGVHNRIFGNLKSLFIIKFKTHKVIQGYGN
jgi:glycosyltransferase involved in cell wall biosynthesis